MRSNFGFNLLATVQTVIGNQSFQVERWITSNVNSIGYNVDQYGPLITYSGNIQPVDRDIYKDLGLDFSKNYIEIYSVPYIDTLTRDDGGDRIHWNSNIYKADPLSRWAEADNYCIVRAVQINNA